MLFAGTLVAILVFTMSGWYFWSFYSRSLAIYTLQRLLAIHWLICASTATRPSDPNLLTSIDMRRSSTAPDEYRAINPHNVHSRSVEGRAQSSATAEENLKTFALLWPDATIPFSISASVYAIAGPTPLGIGNSVVSKEGTRHSDDHFFGAFSEAIEDFHQNTCLTFRPKTAHDRHWAKITANSGCWSYVGMHPELASDGKLCVRR